MDALAPHRSGKWVETLEDRKLLAAFVANVNFQPAKVATPAGYVADTGQAYAAHDNGMTYGWNADETKQMRFHPSKLAADGRFETAAVTRPATKTRAADTWTMSFRLPSVVNRSRRVRRRDGSFGLRVPGVASGLRVREVAGPKSR